MKNPRLDMIPFEGMEGERRYIYACDMNSGESRWSKSAVEHFGLPGEYINNVAEVWNTKIHPDDLGAYLEDLTEAMSGKKSMHNVDYRVMNADGEYDTVTCKGRVIPYADGNGTMFVGAIENHGVASRIDSVTGLYNVYSFLKDAATYKDKEEHDILLIIGINRFSDVNVSYGYEFGNKLLKKFATDMRNNVSPGTKVYRMDGIKFCFAIPETTYDEIRVIYEILKDKAHNGYDIEGNHVSFSISGGIVAVDDKNISEYSIQASLDYVLGQSKNYKHGELVIFSNDNIENSNRNLVVMEAIRNSVFNDMEGFYLCYQPIINVATDSISGAEALLRWQKDPYGSVPPGVFIPWLENDPCFFELGNWILKKALMDTKPLLEKYPDFMINVNVSAEQIERSGFRHSVKKILAETGFPTKNLCIELTERVVSLDLSFLREELNYFRDLGIKIALDDFGTGVSSLNLLLELPVDYLKIDRNFVKDINYNKSEQLIVDTISKCAEGLKLDVCVEGIETVEMKEFLKRYRIAKHQGYLYSKPVTFDKFVQLLGA